MTPASSHRAATRQDSTRRRTVTPRVPTRSRAATPPTPRRATPPTRSRAVTLPTLRRTVTPRPGRGSRSAYWWFALFEALAWVGVLILALIFAALRVPALSILLYVAAVIGSILVSLPLTVRRLHDSDRSGFWYLIAFVPFGGIVLLVFTLLEGTPGPNRFG